MTDETWWRDEARRLYADVERLRRELEACSQREARYRREAEEWQAWRRDVSTRVDATRKAPVSWVAP